MNRIGGMDALTKQMIIRFTPHQNHHPPKMNVLPKKLFFNSILLLNGQCGIKVRPPTCSDDLCLPFCIYRYPYSMVYKLTSEPQRESSGGWYTGEEEVSEWRLGEDCCEQSRLLDTSRGIGIRDMAVCTDNYQLQQYTRSSMSLSNRSSLQQNQNIKQRSYVTFFSPGSLACRSLVSETWQYIAIKISLNVLQVCHRSSQYGEKIQPGIKTSINALQVLVVLAHRHPGGIGFRDMAVCTTVVNILAAKSKQLNQIISVNTKAASKRTTVQFKSWHFYNYSVLLFQAGLYNISFFLTISFSSRPIQIYLSY